MHFLYVYVVKSYDCIVLFPVWYFLCSVSLPSLAAANAS